MRKTTRTKPIGFFSLYIDIGGWFSLIAGLGALIFTAYGSFEYRIATAFENRGIETQAEVVDRSSTYGNAQTFYLTFQFQTASGAQTVEKEVHGLYYDRHAVGSFATI